jgi:polysaccharide pyruvyl transferase WcaK-like protein
MLILVLGFYDRSNLGDEMFKEALIKLLPNDQLFFHNTHSYNETSIETSCKYDAIICGGGDIINEYFYEKITVIINGFNKPIFGIGIGIPFRPLTSTFHVDYFDQLIIREKTDLLTLQKRLGSQYVHYLPDLAFTLDYKRTHRWTSGKTIGVFLAQSLFKHHQIVFALTALLNTLLNKGYNVKLYRFNTSDEECENDGIINKYIYETLVPDHGDNIYDDQKIYNTAEMLNQISNINYAICVRFHAHIFCTMMKVPFISIAATRKVHLLMEENNLEDLSIKIKMDNNWKPFKLDVNQCIDKFNYLTKNDRVIHKKVAYINKQNRLLWKHSKIEALIKFSEKKTIGVNSIFRIDPEVVIKRTIKLFKELGYKNNITAETSLTQDHAQLIATNMCFWLTNDPSNKYVYGTILNMKQTPDKFRDMIYWIYDDNSKLYLQNSGKFNLDYIQQNSFRDLHRAGWQYVIDYFTVLSSPYGVLLDTYLDRTFGWSKDIMKSSGIIPYTSPWVGFVHHTFETAYTEYNNVNMIKDQDFIISLHYCKGIYVLSKYLKDWWVDKLKKLVFPVY